MTHKTGGSGRSRIYTVLRMKEAHNRYATLPYLVDRVGIEPTRGCLQSILVPLHTAQIWCSHSESNQVIRITKPAHHHLCFESKFILKHTHTSVHYASSMCGTNMLQDKLVQAPRFELGSDELKVRCDTVSPYLDCFSFLRRALLLLRCEPAFRLLANTANIFLGFILHSP